MPTRSTGSSPRRRLAGNSEKAAMSSVYCFDSLRSRQSSQENEWKPEPSLSVAWTETSCPVSRTPGGGLNRRVFATESTVVVAPTPMAIVSAVTKAAAGARRKPRRANRTSRTRLMT